MSAASPLMSLAALPVSLASSAMSFISPVTSFVSWAMSSASPAMSFVASPTSVTSPHLSYVSPATSFVSSPKSTASPPMSLVSLAASPIAPPINVASLPMRRPILHRRRSLLLVRTAQFGALPWTAAHSPLTCETSPAAAARSPLTTRRKRSEVEARRLLEFCKGIMEKGWLTTFHVDRNGYHLSFDHVPAWVCTQCGKPYFEERC